MAVASFTRRPMPIVLGRPIPRIRFTTRLRIGTPLSRREMGFPFPHLVGLRTGSGSALWVAMDNVEES